MEQEQIIKERKQLIVLREIYKEHLRWANENIIRLDKMLSDNNAKNER